MPATQQPPAWLESARARRGTGIIGMVRDALCVSAQELKRGEALADKAKVDFWKRFYEGQQQW